MSASSDIEILRQKAKTAVLKGDYDEAIRQAEAALLCLALIPNGEKSGDAGAKIEWDREAISEFIKTVKRSRSDQHIGNVGPMGMSVHPIRYESEVTR